MSVRILDIADSIVALLNAAPLSQSFTASRRYVPKFDVRLSSTFQVAVVPSAETREPSSRGYDFCDDVIHIGVMKKLQDAVEDETSEIDDALELCEEMKFLLNRQRLGDASQSLCTLLQQDPLYSVEDLDNSRVFLTVIKATIRTHVAV